MIAGALIVGTALPSNAYLGKYATVGSYFTNASSCVSWTTNEAIKIDKWKGYTVINATCFRVNGKYSKYRGIVEYYYK